MATEQENITNEEKAEQYYKESKEAIDAYNKEVEEEGLPLNFFDIKLFHMPSDWEINK